jgi:hypothetical protein
VHAINVVGVFYQPPARRDVGFEYLWPIFEPINELVDVAFREVTYVYQPQNGMLADAGKGEPVLRNLMAASILLSVFAHVAMAQPWADKLFGEQTSHDFGTVARATQCEHVFPMQNVYKEAIHIAGVRASCGCAVPRVLKPTLQTWEKGGIAVNFNTRSFLGERKAMITVTIDQPYYAEVQLTVTGFIRGDVVFDPGTVNFESIPLGKGATQTVNVSYAGRSDWQIVDVRSANTNLVVEPVETQRRDGRVEYQLKVHVKSETPAGFFSDQMVLVTNDSDQQQIPLRVEGNVLSELTVSPASLALGVVRRGETVTRSLVVRGSKPFRVLRVACGDDCFQFEPSDEAKPLHVIPVRFTASESAGKVSERIVIETDLGDGASRTVQATATIRAAAG